MDVLRITQLVRQTRKQEGMTVEARADISGFRKTYVSTLENFRITPSIKSWSKMADALGIQTSAFFETSIEPKKQVTGHLDEGEEIERNGSKFGITYHSLAFSNARPQTQPLCQGSRREAILGSAAGNRSRVVYCLQPYSKELPIPGVRNYDQPHAKQIQPSCPHNSCR